MEHLELKFKLNVSLHQKTPPKQQNPHSKQRLKYTKDFQP